MGFLKDFLGGTRPCDVCRLGAVQWTGDRTALIDWSMRGFGLNVSLRICSTCAEAIKQAGLMEKTPLMAVVVLAHGGIANRPPVYAYFQHPEWRKVCMYCLELANIHVSDEFQALAAMKDLEARLFEQVASGWRLPGP
jgi:hypothetical protein